MGGKAVTLPQNYPSTATKWILWDPSFQFHRRTCNYYVYSADTYFSSFFSIILDFWSFLFMSRLASFSIFTFFLNERGMHFIQTYHASEFWYSGNYFWVYSLVYGWPYWAQMWFLSATLDEVLFNFIRLL